MLNAKCTNGFIKDATILGSVKEVEADFVAFLANPIRMS